MIESSFPNILFFVKKTRANGAVQAAVTVGWGRIEGRLHDGFLPNIQTEKSLIMLRFWEAMAVPKTKKEGELRKGRKLSVYIQLINE